jgi:hypothetical protein
MIDLLGLGVLDYERNKAFGDGKFKLALCHHR